MKKSLLFIFTAIISVLFATVISLAGFAQYHIDKSQLEVFAGKTAVVTADIQLSYPYSLEHSDGSTYTDVMTPFTGSYDLKKGDIVIVINETGSNYRVTVPPTGDAGIVDGFLNKNSVGLDKTTILANANKCSYQSGIIGYESQTNAKTTLAGATSNIYQRANGKLLVDRPGGETRKYWIAASDANFDFDSTVTDISMDTYNSLLGGRLQPPKATIVLKVTMNQLQYTVNGVPSMFDVAPYLDTKANRSMIPMRFIAEAFGAAVTWDDATKTQTIMLNGKTFKLKQNVALPDGMGTPVLVKDRFFVPLRYVSQELGASVDWDNATQTNTIVYHK